MPCRLETPDDSIPQSGIVVDPSTTAPDSWTRAVTGASAAAGGAWVPATPEGIGMPLRAMFSLSVTGTPSIGPSGSPRAHRVALAAAAACAALALLT